MKLLITPKTAITFYKNGTIEINSETAYKLTLEDGCYINIAEWNGEYILFKADYGVRMRKVNNTSFNHGFLRGYNKKLSKMMSDGASLAKYRVSDIETHNDKQVVYIITKKNYATERD